MAKPILKKVHPDFVGKILGHLPGESQKTTPTRRLLLAILERAVRDLGNGDEHEEAWFWLRSNKIHFGSFLFICEHVDLDPLDTRKKIEAATGVKLV